MNLQYLVLALTIGLLLNYRSCYAQTIGYLSANQPQPPQEPATSYSNPRQQQPIQAESLTDLVEELSNLFQEIIPKDEGQQVAKMPGWSHMPQLDEQDEKDFRACEFT